MAITSSADDFSSVTSGIDALRVLPVTFLCVVTNLSTFYFENDFLTVKGDSG